MEQGKPFYGMDGCRSERERRCRSGQGRGAAPQGGFPVRACLYLLPETRRQDARRGARQTGSGLDPGLEELAAQ